jgi:hypothetical protein
MASQEDQAPYFSRAIPLEGSRNIEYWDQKTKRWVPFEQPNTDPVVPPQPTENAFGPIEPPSRVVSWSDMDQSLKDYMYGQDPNCHCDRCKTVNLSSKYLDNNK